LTQDSGIRGSGPFTKKAEKANAPPYAGDCHAAEQLFSTPSLARARSLHFALVFSVITGWLRG